MATGVKDLRLWQEAVALAAEIVRAMRQISRRETKGFTDRLMQSAIAVPTGIAQGYGGGVPADQLRLYRGSRDSLVELETHLAVARQAGLLSAEGVAQLASRVSTVSRLLTGYLGYVERQMAADEALAAPATRGAGRPAARAPASTLAALDHLIGEESLGA
jgi:four helix bundle protein